MSIDLATKKDLDDMKNTIVSTIQQLVGNKTDSKYVSKEEAMTLLSCKDTKLSSLRTDRKINTVKIGKEYQYEKISLLEYIKYRSINKI